MKRLKLSSAGHVRVHLVMQWTWAGLAIPTLIWWRESILWVAFMSLYANFVGHASAAEAAEAKMQSDAVDREVHDGSCCHHAPPDEK